jgi:hypothetical protein
MENRKMLIQKVLKLLKVLATSDKTERAEALYAQQITRSPRQSTAVFRLKHWTVDFLLV